MNLIHPCGPRPRGFLWAATLALVAPLPTVQAAGGSAAPVADEAKPTTATSGKFGFHLLPKALQKNPTLDMTVITEMTSEGAKRPLVTPEQPAYYLLQPAGLRSLGEGSVGRKPVPAEALQAMLQGALAKNGFLVANPSGPESAPTLLLVSEWGLHAGISVDQASDPEIDSILFAARKKGGALLADEVSTAIQHDPETRLSLLQSNVLEQKNLLERASLVGGEQFARVLKRVLDQTVERTRRAQDRLIFLTNPEESALHAFILDDPKTRYLFDQAANDVYFVVATAYDYEAFLHGEKHGLWRTKMTVSTTGVSMAESMPVLVRAAAPFLGRPMSEASMLNAPVHRGAQVDIGPTEVIGPEPDVSPAPEVNRK